MRGQIGRQWNNVGRQTAEMQTVSAILQRESALGIGEEHRPKIAGAVSHSKGGPHWKFFLYFDKLAIYISVFYDQPNVERERQRNGIGRATTERQTVATQRPVRASERVR